MSDRMRGRLRARLVATASLMTVAGCEPKRAEPAVGGAHADAPADAAAVADATAIEASVADAMAETSDAAVDAKKDAHRPAAKPSAATPKEKPWIHVMI